MSELIVYVRLNYLTAMIGVAIRELISTRGTEISQTIHLHKLSQPTNIGEGCMA